MHAVDPDAGYGPHDWPRPFLDRLLAELRERPDLPPLDGVRGADADLAAGRPAGRGARA